jgi:heavy metal sensor kinase
MRPAIRSIRFSLILYFLVLLALALGAVSVLSYQASEVSLNQGQEARRDLLKTNFEKDCKEEEERFKTELLNQARLVSREATYQVNAMQRIYAAEAAMTIAGIGGGIVPEGQLTLTRINPILPWETRRQWIFLLSEVLPTTEIQIEEDSLHRDGEASGPEFVQITCGKAIWKSHSLIIADSALPNVDDREFKDKPEEPRFDSVSIPGHPVLARVVVRAPVKIIRLPRGGPGGGSGRWPGPPGSPPGGQPSREPRDARPRDRPQQQQFVEISPISIYVQCANPTTSRDVRLAKLKERYDQDQVDNVGYSRLALMTLRNLLIAIGMATFAAVAVGAWFLAWFGLAPLRRLSDAVSRVSERDFRLKVDGAKLPHELTPIAGRLAHTLQQLGKAFEREKRAAADISHELRTPVAALLTTIEVTLRKPRTAEDYRETLRDCHETGKQMSHLVERMLALAWVDSGGARVSATELDAAELACRCVNLVRPLAEARGLAVRTKVRGTVPATADPDKLREVLVNLLHNAVEYNRPGGSVEVDVRPDAGGVVLEVSDTGIGIPEEIRGSIFERFFRADPSRHATGLHAGLGLAIVREYVELMGGTITVESAVGVGSTFRVRLPRQTDEG